MAIDNRPVNPGSFNDRRTANNSEETSSGRRSSGVAVTARPFADTRSYAMPAAASSSDEEPGYTRPLYNKRSAALKQPGTWPAPHTQGGRDAGLGPETRQFRSLREDDEDRDGDEPSANPGDSWISGRHADRPGAGGQTAGPEKRSAAAAQAESREAIASPAAAEAKGAPVKKRKRTLLRLVWWIVRKSIVPILFVVSLLAGLYIGYTMLGDGPKGDVWEWSTWKHMYDLVFSEK